MSKRTVENPNEQAPFPPPVRTDLFDGVPTEMGDRRAIAMFAHSSSTHHLDRGYDRIEEKLGKLGANIRREKDDIL